MIMRLSSISHWWQSRKVGEKKALKIALALLGFLMSVAAGNWLRTERERLHNAVPLSALQFNQVQEGIAETRRLKSQKTMPHLEGQALANVINSTLHSRQLQMTVTQLGVDRLRVEGTADFDELISWIGELQRNYAVRPLSLSVIRQPSNVKMVAVLGYAG